MESVQFSRSVVSDSLQPHESQHARPPCPSPTPGLHTDSHPLSQWCHPAISSSVVPFSSCTQSLPWGRSHKPLSYIDQRADRRSQFSSVKFSCSVVFNSCDPMNHSMTGLPVHHQLQEFTQTHVHWVSDVIQPSHPLSSPSPPAYNLSQHQGLFK